MNSQMTIATHILTMLAHKEEITEGCALTSEELAESIGTNPVVIRRVLLKLKEAGLIESRRGAGGGSALSQAPSKVSLREVYEAVTCQEKPLIGRHTGKHNEQCDVGSIIVDYLDELLGEAEQALLDRLEATTIADMTHEVCSRMGGVCPTSKVANKS